MRRPEGPRQAFGGVLGPLGGPLEAILRLKMAYDRSSWPKTAPKHENLIKHEGCWGLKSATREFWSPTALRAGPAGEGREGPLTPPWLRGSGFGFGESRTTFTL